MLTFHPERYESTAVVRDGTTITIRPMRAGDAEAVLDLHARLSPRSRYLRFLSPVPRLGLEHLRYLVEIDHARVAALVAELEGRIVGVAHCFRCGDGHHGDLAIVVDDSQQRHGIGPALLRRLLAVALDGDISMLDVDIAAENHRMLRILSATGLPARRSLEAGVVHLELALPPATTAMRAG